MATELREIERAIVDPVAFADLIGAPLWKHQAELARSQARYRVVCAGRRSGKTRTFSVLCLWWAFSRAGSKVLIVSAGEDAAKNMFADIAALVAGSALLRGSVVDELTSVLTLSNGSQIRAVASSMKQVRSQEADLLVVDEAGQVAEDIWDAVEPVIVARPGSRVLVSSSPWGGPGKWFYDLWKLGMDSPSADVQSWHWPSTVSPEVDVKLLESIRQRKAPWAFAREYLAEWSDASGAYFSESELKACVADYRLLDPGQVGHLWAEAVAGVDWGMARDANALVLLSPLEDYAMNESRWPEGERNRRPIYVPWLEANYGWTYTRFIDRVVKVCESFAVHQVASERNGVGEFPTQELRTRLRASALTKSWSRVSPVWTDARRKMTGFGQLKGMMQRGHLVLPNHPELLRQLRGLEFEQSETGLTRIAVPDRNGHDDLAMSLLQAASCLTTDGARWSPQFGNLEAERATREYRRRVAEVRRKASEGRFEVTETSGGVTVPVDAEPASLDAWWWRGPAGSETSDGW